MRVGGLFLGGDGFNLSRTELRANWATLGGGLYLAADLGGRVQLKDLNLGGQNTAERGGLKQIHQPQHVRPRSPHNLALDWPQTGPGRPASTPFPILASDSGSLHASTTIPTIHRSHSYAVPVDPFGPGS